MGGFISSCFHFCVESFFWFINYGMVCTVFLWTISTIGMMFFSTKEEIEELKNKKFELDGCMFSSYVIFFGLCVLYVFLSVKYHLPQSEIFVDIIDAMIE